ncbi:MAG: FKBP-type peptidyl-prolyl cis-trans isomerase [Bacteroidota bacterium]
MANRRFRGSAGNNKKRGGDFLLQNAQKTGIIETESGLQYTIIEKTNGDLPGEDSQVVFHQRVLLLNGTILEDSYKTNKPAEARVSELLEGLAEGIQKMPLGSRFKFWLPPDLAWGQKGSSDRIPPNAVIQFDIRLLEIIE